MRIRPVETSGLPMPFQRRGQGPVIVGSPDPLAWANKADGAKHAWDFIANAARWNGQYIGALANTPNWTFTRASTGYAQTSGGVLQSFASGELRRTDKGVLIEGARTNTQTSTNRNPSATTNISLVDTGTGGSIAVVDDSAELAALGLTGNVLRIIGGTNIAYANFMGGAATNVPHVCSAYIRGGTGLIVYSSGGALSHAFGASASYVRVVAAATAPGAVARTMMIGANAGQTLYVTLHVMEAGSFVSSPIPVAGASATRAADTLSVPVSLASPLTMYAEFEYSGADSSFGLFNRYAFQVGPNNTNRAILYNAGTNGANSCVVQISGATQANPNVGASIIPVGVPQKVALAVATNDFRIVSNGTLGTADTSGTALSDITIAKLGGDPTSELYGYLRRAALWTRALTDAELQAVTT